MAKNYDFALVNNDVLIMNNDFVLTESDEQHIADNINAFPGWWKQYPADGVGIFQYMGSAGKEQEAAQSIKINLQGDGYQVSNPVVSYNLDGQLEINPNATKV